MSQISRTTVSATAIKYSFLDKYFFDGIMFLSYPSIRKNPNKCCLTQQNIVLNIENTSKNKIKVQ